MVYPASLKQYLEDNWCLCNLGEKLQNWLSFDVWRILAKDIIMMCREKKKKIEWCLLFYLFYTLNRVNLDKWPISMKWRSTTLAHKGRWMIFKCFKFLNILTFKKKKNIVRLNVFMWFNGIIYNYNLQCKLVFWVISNNITIRGTQNCDMYVLVKKRSGRSYNA